MTISISPFSLALLSLDIRMLRNAEKLSALSKKYVEMRKSGDDTEAIADEIRKLISQQEAIDEVFGEAEKRNFPLYSITGGRAA